MSIGEANIILAERYLKIASATEFKEKVLVEALCEYIIERPDLYLDKSNRWIGFVQGILFCQGLIEIEEERDFSRELFHMAYVEAGVKIPETVDVMEGRE
jgi:energy-converting hydrogenase Eha subunit C